MIPLRVAVPDEGYHRNLISCQVACPVHTDARGYIRAIAEGRFDDAYLTARGPNPFASICGRVCGVPCEAACRRGEAPRVDDDGAFVANDRPIAIRALKRLVCEMHGPKADGAAVLRNVQNFDAAVAANAEEMAALLHTTLDGRLRSGNGQKVAIMLAALPDGAFAVGREVARQTHIPPNYLSKSSGRSAGQDSLMQPGAAAAGTGCSARRAESGWRRLSDFSNGIIRADPICSTHIRTAQTPTRVQPIGHGKKWETP